MAEKDGMSKLSVWIPKGIHAEALYRSRLKGMTLMEYVKEALEERNEMERGNGK